MKKASWMRPAVVSGRPRAIISGRCHSPHKRPSSKLAAKAGRRACIRGRAKPRQPSSSLDEELGWRGFALPRMQARRPAFAASLLLGLLWGLWHLPLMMARGLPLTTAGLIQLAFFILLVTAWAVLFTWVYNNTNGSLFLMVLMHT